ncbi:DUF1740-domain-containing protein [Zopfia rhizophila CBS 207.26]|uniref:DUF1740-domain-containing protein n=1 Tax=Zopfia rhizophila CBS 207.26 TaxID=1314779 RepID=A0A6A6DXB0_9PEZI|nr:DUF1740-domain-containing protein [Zopfia rhizophila CBS 207.26]
MNSNVPKFASFRPKHSAEHTREREPSPPKHSKHRQHRDEKHDDKARREAYHSRHCGYSRHQSHKESKSQDRRVGTEHQRTPATEKAQADLYIIDRKGDPANLVYGCLNHYRIPLYRRYGNGRVVGIPMDRFIDKNLSTEKETVISSGKSGPELRHERPLTSKQNSRDSFRKERLVKADANSQSDVTLEYVSLSGTGKRKRGKDMATNCSDYRSLEKIGESDDDSSDLDTHYESDAELQVSGSEITQKNAALTHKTRDHPQNLQVWLDLIDHQEAMMSLGHASISHELIGRDRRHLADIKISIYEQALRKIGPDKDSQIRLVLGLMNEASRHWDSGILTQRWKEVLAKFPHSIELWTAYLDFIQSIFADFKYETCRAAFHACLKAVATLQAGEGLSRHTILETSLYIIIRMTAMIKGAGYQELAVAIWQALLEYHLLRPDNLANLGAEADAECLRLFEEFWESEVPRIGEQGAVGWKHWDAENPLAPDPVPNTLTHSNSADSGFEAFQKHEQDRINKLRYPGRTADEAGEDDPFHLVLFSDLGEYLRILPPDIPNLLLIQAFLCFNRLPPISEIQSKRVWWLDPFLREELLDSHLGQSSSSSETEEYLPSTLSKALNEFMGCPMRHFQMTTDLLFDYGFTHSAGSLDIGFIRRSIQLLSSTMSDDMIGEYLLAFELKYFPSEVGKTAKKLLKAHPRSARLYNAYGLVELRRGNKEKADFVFHTALSIDTGSSGIVRPGNLELFHSWVWEALRRGERLEALWRLVSPKGDMPMESRDRNKAPDSAAILRARTTFTDGNDHALSAHDYSSAILYTLFLALLTYLSNNQDINSALTVHQNLSTRLAKHNLSQSPVAEVHAQAVAQLLAFHATSAPIVKPALLRTNLEPLIATFPNNTIFLAMYAANESRFRIEDRVRDILRPPLQGSRQEPSIVRWFFALFFEMKRGGLVGSTAHSVRALFRRAEASDVGSNSPALWKSHVLFEVAEAEKARARQATRSAKRGKGGMVGREGKGGIGKEVDEAAGRVKDAFFRGLTRLPWCKEYMMLAFTHLRDFLEEEELRRMYNVLVEKELRVYVDLDTA